MVIYLVLCMADTGRFVNKLDAQTGESTADAVYSETRSEQINEKVSVGFCRSWMKRFGFPGPQSAR